MHPRHRPTLKAILSVAAVAIGLSVVGASPALAAMPEGAFGPLAGQLLRPETRVDDAPAERTTPVTLGASATQASGYRAVIASSARVGPGGELVDVAASGPLDTPFGPAVMLTSIQLKGVGAYWWQIASADGATAPVPFEFVVSPPASPPVLAATRRMLSPLGYRGMRIGMTRKQAERASQLKLARTVGGSSSCLERRDKRSGIHTMFVDGRLVRVSDWIDGAAATLGGLKPGDPSSRIMEVFGRSVVSAAIYGEDFVAGGWYWDIAYKRGIYKGRAIRFVTGQTGVIEDVIVGLPDPVSYTEGCG